MGDDNEMYTELPADADPGFEVYEELTADMTEGIQKGNQVGSAPPVPETRRPLPQAPHIPDRNPTQARDLPQLPPQPVTSGKSKFYDQPPGNPQRRLPQVPSAIPSAKEPGALRVSDAFQIFIQSKKTGSSKSQYSTPWSKRPDPSGQDVEFLPLQGNGSHIPFVPPCILVKLPQGTEIATGNYLRLFIPPVSSSQQSPPRATGDTTLPPSAGAEAPESPLLYDETTMPSEAGQETYDDVVQKPEPTAPLSEPDLTYDDVTNVRENGETPKDYDLTYDDVIPKSKPDAKESTGASDIYDDVEVANVSNRNSPTPSNSSEVNSKGKVDKKAQKVEAQRVKRREKSIKNFKQLSIKPSDPYLQDLVSQTASGKSKDKDLLQIAEGERVQLLLQEHPKLKDGHWLVEKADGTIGLAQSSLFTS